MNWSASASVAGALITEKIIRTCAALRPHFNANNEPAAAISVVGTRLEINEENRDYLAGKAIACAKDISRLLGWKSPFDSLAS